MTDEEILTALRTLRRVTLFTRDADFYRRDLCHPNYCLVLIAASADDMAAYAIQFLRHRSFRTYAQRMGAVVRLQPSGIVYWSRRHAAELFERWG
ncbi:MAG: hypothetical protein SFV51_17315 [Bryobacteraceae bacterium]|nr:hypothetical protein [Bryobacteraceae bacterium]